MGWGETGEELVIALSKIREITVAVL